MSSRHRCTDDVYAATLSKYVLVDAANERDAERLGQVELRKLYDVSTQVQIRTVRPATPDEIDFWDWHLEKVAAESR